MLFTSSNNIAWYYCPHRFCPTRSPYLNPTVLFNNIGKRIHLTNKVDTVLSLLRHGHDAPNSSRYRTPRGRRRQQNDEPIRVEFVPIYAATGLDTTRIYGIDWIGLIIINSCIHGDRATFSTTAHDVPSFPVGTKSTSLFFSTRHTCRLCFVSL